MTIPHYTDEKLLRHLADRIRGWAAELGFQQVGITDTDLSAIGPDLHGWLAEQRHGEMDWMARNVGKRLHPERLNEGTLRVLSLRMNYQPANIPEADANHPQIARYALGRDYHKMIRKRLAQLATRIREAAQAQEISQRPFVDSAPVLEKPLAVKAGLGWQGRNTLLLNREAGSWFFLGEIYTSLPLPIDEQYTENHCAACTSCISSCPTGALDQQGRIDARRCIAYLSIEHRGSIPLPFRRAMGNRIFGCDDCQTCCPWNKRSPAGQEQAFRPRSDWNRTLSELISWDEDQYLRATEGSPLRRLGYQRWLRNLAVALGNAPATDKNIAALQQRADHSDELVREHVSWALNELQTRRADH